MEIYAAKILIALGLFLLTIVFGGIPLIISRVLHRNVQTADRWVDIQALMNSVTGGIFVSLFLIHMLPEVHDNLKHVLKTCDISTNFPLAEFIVAVGFFVVFIMELPFTLLKTNKIIGLSAKTDSTQISIEDDKITNNAVSTSKRYSSLSSDWEVSLESDLLTKPGHKQRSYTEESTQKKITGLENSAAVTTTPLRIIILLSALALHYIFEGLAIGAIPSEAQMISVTVGVASHKTLIALGYGFKLTQSCFPVCKHLIYITALGCMTPVGVGIGMAATSIETHEVTRALVTQILEGLATGTFLYVTFFEILNKSAHDALNILCILLGFAALTALQFAK